MTEFGLRLCFTPPDANKNNDVVTRVVLREQGPCIACRTK